MNQTAFDKKRVLKGKTPITILAVISLVCTVLGSITYFAFYSNDELTFELPSFLSLISLSLTLASKVLLVLYVVKFFKEFKATIIVPIIFGCIAANNLLNLINTFVFGYGLNGITLITNLIGMVTFTLATISALKGLSYKVFIIIPTALSLALNALSLISLFSIFEVYVRWGYTTRYLFTQPLSIIASVTFNIALLLFALKNRIPAILAVSPEKEKKNAEKMTPEQSLRLLKDKLDLGVITEEEYQAQRAEIISKL